MKYIIMCGGTYTAFEEPRQFIKINGERVIDRTVRLLKENGCEVYITATDKRFDFCGVPRLEHRNNFVCKGNDEELTGYWLDAFYPNFADTDKVTYIFGDVYFTEDAIRTIVNYQTDGNVLFGTIDAKNVEHENWGEPFAYIVNDYPTFMAGVRAVKKMQDEGKLKRHPIVWELYRYLNGLDVNVQQVLDETYVCIDDGTLDVDSWVSVEKIRRRFEDAPDDNSTCV